MAARWKSHGHSGEDIALEASNRSIYLDMIEVQRQWLLNKNKEEKTLNEDVVRKHLKYLDLEEEKLK
jgi:CPA1 family monovalent cation:H+ antiporter